MRTSFSFHNSLLHFVSVVLSCRRKVFLRLVIGSALREISIILIKTANVCSKMRKFASIITILLVTAIHGKSLQDTNSGTNYVRIRPGQQFLTDHWVNQAHSGALSVSEMSQPSNLEHLRTQHQAPHQARSTPIVMPPSNTNNEIPHQIPNTSWLESVNLNANGSLGEQAYNYQKTPKKTATTPYSYGVPPVGVGNNQGSLLSTNLELALRQANGDESVFQPSATIGLPNHDSYDWGGAGQSSTLNQNLRSNSRTNHDDNANPTENHANMPTLAPLANRSLTATPGTTALELSNQMPIVLNYSQSTSFNQKEDQTNANTSLEFNNQIIHEGPATPPSAISMDDFYFSSSEKNANNKDIAKDYNEPPHSNAWW